MADCAAVLDAQRKEHPELGEHVDKLQAQSNAKLYHQLTQSLLQYLRSPPFEASKAGASTKLSEFFEGFIRQFESKFDKVRWVEILAIVTKPQTAEAALELVNSFEAHVANNRDATYLWQALKAEKLTVAGKLEEAKELLEGLLNDIENAYEVDALIQSNVHKAYMQLWKKLDRPQEFYRSSILYLAYTPLAAIPAEERPRLAFEIGVAALVAPDEFDFGELVQQELISSLEGSSFAWIKDMLQAFCEGKFQMYDTALSKNRAAIDGTPELKGKEATVLRPKMQVLALMDLAFRKPKKQRRIGFEELASHCRVGPKEVEHLVMKSMSQKLIEGSIDEVQELVNITWVKPRILDSGRIDLIRERIDAWAAQTGLLLDHLEEVTPELLVS